MKKPKKSKVQHVNWTAPYQPGSGLHMFHQAMMKKGGLTYSKFKQMIKKTGNDPRFILKVMRSGLSRKGWTWDFVDKGERYRITNLKKFKVKG
jgi:hypothetical protein